MTALDSYFRFRGLLGLVGAVIFTIWGVITGSVSIMTLGTMFVVVSLLLFAADYYLSTT
jgi:hypothetical protein